MNTFARMNQDTLDGCPSDTVLVTDPWEESGIEEGERRDSWLLNYIDILTLILTLFVLLLALQPKDQTSPQVERALMPPTEANAFLPGKDLMPVLPPPEVAPEDISLPSAADATASVLPEPADHAAAHHLPEPPLTPPLLLPQGTGLLENTRHLVTVELIMPPQPMEAVDEPVAAEETTAPLPTPAAEAASPASDLVARLEAAGLDERIQVSPQERGIHLEIRDNILFTPGSAVLTNQGRALLDELTLIFMPQEYNISVEGHTDDRPISTARFPSNWELSTGRASQVARYLIDRGIGSQRLQAVGYADTRPISDNQTTEGRTRNRRVSLVLEIPKTHPH